MARGKNDTRVNRSGDTVAGLFQNQAGAEAAMQRLTAAGFLEQQLGVAVRNLEDRRKTAEQKGDLLSVLASLGFSEEDVSHFEHGFERGKVLLTVETDGRIPEARQLLEEAGFDDQADVRILPYEGRERRTSSSAYGGPERRLGTY